MEIKTLEQYFLAENEALRENVAPVDAANGVGTVTHVRHILVMYDIDRDALALAVKRTADKFGSFGDWVDGLSDYRVAAWAMVRGAVSIDRVVAVYAVKVDGRRYGIVPPASANDAGGVADLDAPFDWGVWLDDETGWLPDLAEAIRHEASECQRA